MRRAEREEKEIISSLKKIMWGAGIVFIGRIIGKIIGYFYVMIVARLGTEQYGMLNLGFALSSLLTTLALLGLSSGIVRYVSFHNAKKDKARIKGAITSSLRISIPLSLFFTLIMFSFAEQISVYFFHNPDLTPILRVFSFTIPFFTAAYLFMAVFQGFKRIDYDTGLREITEKLVRLGFVLLLIPLGFGVFGASLSYIASSFVIFIASLYLMEKKVFPILKTKVKAIHYPKEIFFYSFPLLLSSVLLFFVYWVDTLMLGFFRTTSEVGIYGVAVPTAALMFVLPGALTSIFLPIIVQFYSKKKMKEMQKAYSIVSRWIFSINVPIFLLLAAFSRQILGILFDNAYVAASSPLIILSLGYLVYSFAHTSIDTINTVKKTKIFFTITAIYTSINVLLNYILIPTYGINGAAIATSTSFVVNSFLIIFFSYKYTRLQPFRWSYIKPLLAALLSICIVAFIARALFEVTSIYGLVLMFLLFSIIYVLLLLLFRSFEREDLEMFRILLKKLPHKRLNHRTAFERI